MFKQRKSQIEAILIILCLLILITISPKNIIDITGKFQRCAVDRECNDYPNEYCDNDGYCQRIPTTGEPSTQPGTPSAGAPGAQATKCEEKYGSGLDTCCDLLKFHCTLKGSKLDSEACPNGRCCPREKCLTGSRCEYDHPRCHNVIVDQSTKKGEVTLKRSRMGTKVYAFKGTCTLDESQKHATGYYSCNFEPNLDDEGCYENNKWAVNFDEQRGWIIDPCDQDEDCRLYGSLYACGPKDFTSQPAAGEPEPECSYDGKLRCHPDTNEREECDSNLQWRQRLCSEGTNCKNGICVTDECSKARGKLCGEGEKACYGISGKEGYFHRDIPNCCINGQCMTLDEAKNRFRAEGICVDHYDCAVGELCINDDCYKPKTCTIFQEEYPRPVDCCSSIQTCIGSAKAYFGDGSTWCSGSCETITEPKTISCDSDKFCTIGDISFGQECTEPGACVECLAHSDCLLRKCTSGQNCECVDNTCIEEPECRIDEDCYRRAVAEQHPDRRYKCENYKCKKIIKTFGGTIKEWLKWLFRTYS